MSLEYDKPSDVTVTAWKRATVEIKNIKNATAPYTYEIVEDDKGFMEVTKDSVKWHWDTTPDDVSSKPYKVRVKIIDSKNKTGQRGWNVTVNTADNESLMKKLDELIKRINRMSHLLQWHE